MKTELDKFSVIVSEEEFLPVVLLLLEEQDQLVFLVTVGIRNMSPYQALYTFVCRYIP